MRPKARATIIIDNYNYGSYLSIAIESALGQSYRSTEVIVVDDGSTDDSHEVIARYEGAIVPVLKNNGGQASAFNAGLECATGEIVLLLDADDWLMPDALEAAVEMFDAPGIVKVHWPLIEVDGAGRPTGTVVPSFPLDEGDLAAMTLREGPLCYSTSPTSGNAWARSYLERVMPLRELGNRHGADAYLSIPAPLFGSIRRIDRPLGFYRVHEKSFSGNASSKKRTPALFDIHCRLLNDFLKTRGAEPVRSILWKKRYYAWELRCREGMRELRAMTAKGDRVIVVDDGQLAHDRLDGRIVLPFLECGGEYTGPPADDATAVAELERMRGEGAGWIAFFWPAYWWLDYYTGFARHLDQMYTCAARTDRLILFDLHRAHDTSPNDR